MSTKARGATGREATPGAGVHLVCLTSTPGTGALLREALAIALPSAQASIAEDTTPRSVPAADCLLVDERVGDLTGVDLLRDLRARGYAGGAVLLHDTPDVALRERAGRLGASIVGRGDGAAALGGAVVAALPAGDERTTRAREELRRTEQLIAAGEVALRLQHALNNPLTALLAEAQLLEMEPLPEEQLGAVRRIVELCRRTVNVARQLDQVGAESSRRG